MAKGGRGGKGNAFFKSPTNRAPEHTQPGEAGDKGVYRLSLKLVADVGLIGFPNAGKSTLISRVSAARPKIADYPFTTLVPHLGVARTKSGKSFVVADIPGLIPGASEGKGLGTTFLKHIERTRLLLHLVTLTDEPGRDPLHDYEVVRRELTAFKPELAERPELVVLSQADRPEVREAHPELKQAFQERFGVELHAMSAVSHWQLTELLLLIARKLPQREAVPRDIARPETTAPPSDPSNEAKAG